MATPLLGLATPTTGTQAGTWGDTLNNEVSGYLDNIIAGLRTISLSASNVLLTAAQARDQTLRFTGTLLTNVQVSPDAGVLWYGFRCVENMTSGAFTLTLANGAGSVVLPSGRRGIVYIDSTNGPRMFAEVSTTNADTIPAGYPMPFYAAAAPTGWTQNTSLNDYALRIVSGTGAGTGGNVDFSTLFGRTSTDPYTLQIADIPLHGHPVRISTERDGAKDATGGFALDETQLANYSAYTGTPNNTPGQQIGGTGGNGSHSHNIDMRVKYANFIIAAH